MLSNRTAIGFWAALLLACVGLVSGCRTAKGPGSESLVSVVIKGHSAFDVARAAARVFEGAGFTAVPLGSNKEMKLLFEKEAGAQAAVLYGGWSSSQVWYRVRLHIETLDPSTQLLACDAFRVLDHGDTHFEKEQRLTSVKKGYYKKLLKKVELELKSPS